MKKKYGSAYSMVNVRRRGCWSLYYPVFFFLRRAIFVAAVTGLYNFVVFQIMLYLLPTIVLMIHMG